MVPSPLSGVFPFACIKPLSFSSLPSFLTDSSVAPPSRQNRRRWDLWFPWLLFAGFFLLSLLLFGERLVPARSVVVEKVVAIRSNSSAGADPAASTVGASEIPSVTGMPEGPAVDPHSGVVLFQASGWVEPDPLPIKAASLLDGVVESVSVLEGETVQKGQLLATLIREDFELDLETAQSELVSLRGLYRAHEAAIETVHAELRKLTLQVEAGERKSLELQDRRDRFSRVEVGAVSETERISAELMLQTQEAEVQALASSAGVLDSELARLEALRGDFEGRIAKAETEVARRRLALERTGIRSPVDGIVLRLLVSPGQKRMLNMDDPDSSTVAVLYRPDSLQARIDVPLEDASQLGVGQAVRLRSSFLPDRIFAGTVTRIAGEADLQRNTLQVKVRFHDPDRRLRPDMLCRAEFLAMASPGSGEPGGPGMSEVGDAGTGADRVLLYVPASALIGESGGAAQVWTFDPSGKRAELRQVVPGREEREGYRQIKEGLRPGDFVLTDPPSDLVVGERIAAETGGGI